MHVDDDLEAQHPQVGASLLGAGTYKADVKGINIRYYFDDEEKPRVDMDVSTFFSEKNPRGIFRDPLAMNGGDDFRMLRQPQSTPASLL